MRERNTRDEWHLLVNYGYGHGWEHEVTEDSRSEINARLKEYRENAPQYPCKVVKRRVRKLFVAAATLLGLAACGGQSEPAAAKKAARTEWRVEYCSGSHTQIWCLVPLNAPDSVDKWVYADSLSLTIKRGEVVRRCYRPTSDGRVVTWCRKTTREEAGR